MRSIAFALGMAVLLVATAASATGGVSGKGDTCEGKDGTGPATSTESGASGTAEATSGIDTSQRPFGGCSTQISDVAGRRKVEEKSWEVSASCSRVPATLLLRVLCIALE